MAHAIPHPKLLRQNIILSQASINIILQGESKYCYYFVWEEYEGSEQYQEVPP